MSSGETASWIESASAGASNPLNWLAAAERAKRGSDILRAVWLREVHELPSRIVEIRRRMETGETIPEPEASVGAPAMLLAGYALENEFKGLIVATDPTRVLRGSGAMLDWRGKGHDLPWLASEADINDLDQQERDLLEHLTEFTLWAGKYPVALRASAMQPRPTAEHGGATFSDALFPTIDALFARLRESLLRASQVNFTSDE